MAPATAPIQGTPGEILQEIPVVEPLTVGYKAGLFQPVGTMKKKDKRGCTTRNQLLIKLATKKPKIGKKCSLKGGEWLVDFGMKTVKKASDVKLTTLLPDKFVYAQGAYGWTEQQRKVYRDNYTPGQTTARKSRSSLANLFTGATIQPLSKTPAVTVGQFHTVLDQLSQPGQTAADIVRANLELDELQDKNPAFWNRMTAATILNAKSWGLSFDPTLYRDFEVTISECSQEDTEKGDDNPCTTVYSVTNEAARYNIQAVPMSASIRAPLVSVGGGFSSPQLSYGTATGPAITPTLFGIHSPAHWVSDIASGIEGPIDEDTIASVPAGYVRLWDTETTWADIEPNKGEFEWRTFEKQVQVAERKGAKVMMVFGGTPAWASAAKTPQSMPDNISDWRDYVRAVSCRNAGRIDAYEIWNEANLQTFWTGTPEQMAELTAAAKEEIAGCDPTATVVAASTTTRATGSFGTFYPAYLNALKAKSWPIDAYSVHSYPRSSGGADDRIAGIGQFKTMLALAEAPVRPIFDTEVNYGLAGLGEGRTVRSGLDAMALLSRTFIDSARYGFESTFWFVWTTAATAELDQKFGITLTPSAAAEQQAWRTTYDWLVGAQFQRCFQTENDVTVCQFNKGPDNFSLVWRGDVGSGPSETVPGFFARLGSRQCNLFGQCEPLSVNATTTVSPVPLRIDGAPLVTGTSDAETAPAAPSVTNPVVEYGNDGSATYRVSINPDATSSARVDSYEITVLECMTEDGRDCRTLSDETVPNSGSLRYSLALGGDVYGFIQTSVRARNAAGVSPVVVSDRVQVGLKDPRAVSDLTVGVASNETIGIKWKFIPPRPNTDLSYVINIRKKYTGSEVYSDIFFTDVAPQFSGASIAWKDITGPRDAKLLFEGDQFEVCVTMKSNDATGPTTCQRGVITTRLPAVSGAEVFVDPDYTVMSGTVRIASGEGAENIRGLEIQWLPRGSKTWKTIPSLVPGVTSQFIPVKYGAGDQIKFGITIEDGEMSSSNAPKAIRIRTVSQPEASGGKWFEVDNGGRVFIGGARIR